MEARRVHQHESSSPIDIKKGSAIICDHAFPQLNIGGVQSSYTFQGQVDSDV